jgi:hypothetical protein
MNRSRRDAIEGAIFFLAITGGALLTLIGIL